MTGVTRVVIGDDHALFLDAASTVLARQNYTVTVAATVADTLAALKRDRPDVCLVDRHFGGEDGVAAIRVMIKASAGTKVLVLSADADRKGVLAALQAGAHGYLHKTRGISALIAAIERVLRGEVVVDLPRADVARLGPAAEYGEQRGIIHLTAQERRCLELLLEGQGTAAMARTLAVSRATVRTHVQSVLTKLGVHSRLEAASVATRYRLLHDEGARPRAVGPARRAAGGAGLLPRQKAVCRRCQARCWARQQEHVTGVPFSACGPACRRRRWAEAPGCRRPYAAAG